MGLLHDEDWMMASSMSYKTGSSNNKFFRFVLGCIVEFFKDVDIGEIRDSDFETEGKDDEVGTSGRVRGIPSELKPFFVSFLTDDIKSKTTSPWLFSCKVCIIPFIKRLLRSKISFIGISLFE